MLVQLLHDQNLHSPSHIVGGFVVGVVFDYQPNILYPRLTFTYLDGSPRSPPGRGDVPYVVGPVGVTCTLPRLAAQPRAYPPALRLAVSFGTVPPPCPPVYLGLETPQGMSACRDKGLFP